MKTKPLIETNPYLRDAKTMHKLIARSARTSSGVEGIKESHVVAIKITHRKDKNIYKSAK